MTEILTDEQAALIWSGSGTLNNFDQDTSSEESEKTLETDTTEESGDETEKKVNNKDLDGIFRSSEEDDDEDEAEETESVPKNTEKVTETSTSKKPGRKPVELVEIVNKLIEEDILKPFEDSEVKTIDDAKELIKLNLEASKDSSKEEWWKEEVSSYSPQVQAVLHYAKQGGKDVSTFLQAIEKIESISDLTVDTEAGQEEIVRQTLKLKNFDNEEIEDQISTLKDLDKLKTKAEKFLPELNNMQQQQVAMLMREQEETQRQAQEATRIYLQTVQNTLSKDTIQGVKLQREDKAKIYEALAAPKYKSLNGEATSGFVKTLEELQFGKNTDYEHFLNIVHFTVDPKSFLDKLAVNIKNEVQADTARRIKQSKTTTPNTETENEQNISSKGGVKRSGFRNPFA